MQCAQPNLVFNKEVNTFDLNAAVRPERRLSDQKSEADLFRYLLLSKQKYEKERRNDFR